MSHTDYLIFFVNGKKIVDARPDPEETLLSYLRSKLRLTGSKEGCGQGACGSCTVMISQYDKERDIIRHWAAVSCLTRVVSCHGQAVTTVEGLGSTRTALHPVQERLAKAHGSQCGFCTPGMVMAMYALLRNNPKPSLQDVEVAIEGNLCRCTGYRTILDGFNTFTKEYCEMGQNCCRNQAKLPEGYQESLLMFNETFAQYDATQELIFPPDLKVNHERYNSKMTIFIKGNIKWYRPSTLKDLLDLRVQYLDAPIVLGNAAVGTSCKGMKGVHPVMISGANVRDLLLVSDTKTGIKVGPSVTLTGLERELTSRIKKLEDWKVATFQSIVDVLRWYATVQIRNVVAVGSTIMTSTRNSDLTPVFMASGSSVDVISKRGGKRNVPLNANFFGSTSSPIRKGEVILCVNIPFSKRHEFVQAYLHGDRRVASLSRVNACFRVLLGQEKVQDVAMCYGGIGDVVLSSEKTTAFIKGREWNDTLVTSARQSLEQELEQLMVMDEDRKYRKALALGFFFKFYLNVKQRLNSQDELPKEYLSAGVPYSRGTIQGSQYYHPVPTSQLEADPIGRPIVHVSAMKQTTGEAIYLDDISKRDGELQMVLVPSDRAHAKVISIDTSAVMTMPGVIDVITHKDVPGSNRFGLMDHSDEEFLVSDEVLCCCQSLAAIIAETREQAVEAVQKVKVDYEDLESILTIQDAIKKESFMEEKMTDVNHGDIEKGMAFADHVIEGEVSTEAQDHFYMETHGSLVIPGEEGELEIYCGAQHLQPVQVCAETALGLKAHKVNIKVKRIGGAFGGKDTRFKLLLAPALVAVNKLGRPVRAVFDRVEDIQRSGTRHPFLAKYKVGFTKEGKLIAVDLQYFLNAGMSKDISGIVLLTALSNSGGYFNVPNFRIHSKLCKTNLPSRTAFRGMGSPQVKIIAETFVTHVAEFLGKQVEQIRELNLYHEGDYNHFNDKLTSVTVRRCWDDCKMISEFEKRRQMVDDFNKSNRWRKRGISLVGTMHSLGYNALMNFFNQASALVNVYTDGSVLIHHGGIEFGQGLSTKMIQIASRILKIPMSMIHISETNTNIIPNASGTNASTASDINGMAVKNACEILMARLKPYKEAKPEANWKDWVMMAYLDRVPLSASGFFRMSGLDYDPVKKTGKYYTYYVYGAACTEVEIDVLTGENKTLRTDIVMDVGTSMNPAIDIGQVEGAFMIGLGLVSLENFKISLEGKVLVDGPQTYKIPCVQNVPEVFNVVILRDSQMERAVYSSKGVGEAPLALATSVLCAIRDAVKSARTDEGETGYFRFDCPATPERIRMTCLDQFSK